MIRDNSSLGVLEKFHRIAVDPSFPIFFLCQPQSLTSIRKSQDGCWSSRHCVRLLSRSKEKNKAKEQRKSILPDATVHYFCIYLIGYSYV